MGSAQRREIDFDHHSPEFAVKSVDVLEEMRDSCPMGFSAKYGGYWAVFSHRHGKHVFRDYADFSVSKWRDEDGTIRGGIVVPTLEGLDLIPGELDKPEWDPYRKLLNPVFSPSAVRKLRPQIALLADDLIDGFIETGKVDMVLDLANLLPPLVTLDFLGLDRDDLHLFSDPFHQVTWARAGTPEWLEAVEGFRRMPAVLMARVADRRARPEEDYISALLEMQVDGRPFTDEELVQILMQLLAGGVDSTAALLANVFMYLNGRDEDRQRLRTDPELLRYATEEFVRYFTPIQALARTATRPVTVLDQTVDTREPVLVSLASMNRDRDVFAAPNELRLDRRPNPHVGFGLGIHRCLGSNFARAMFQITLQKTLERLPDYVIDTDLAQPYRSKAVINGWVTMPATFTPGPRVNGPAA